MADLLQEQWRALSLPQEHLAWAAQTQPAPALVLQQVEAGWTILKIGGGGGGLWLVVWLVGGGDVDRISLELKIANRRDRRVVLCVIKFSEKTV